MPSPGFFISVLSPVPVGVVCGFFLLQPIANAAASTSEATNIFFIWSSLRWFVRSMRRQRRRRDLGRLQLGERRLELARGVLVALLGGGLPAAPVHVGRLVP